MTQDLLQQHSLDLQHRPWTIPRHGIHGIWCQNSYQDKIQKANPLTIQYSGISLLLVPGARDPSFSTSSNVRYPFPRHIPLSRTFPEAPRRSYSQENKWRSSGEAVEQGQERMQGTSKGQAKETILNDSGNPLDHTKVISECRSASGFQIKRY